MKLRREQRVIKIYLQFYLINIKYTVNQQNQGNQNIVTRVRKLEFFGFFKLHAQMHIQWTLDDLTSGNLLLLTTGAIQGTVITDWQINDLAESR